MEVGKIPMMRLFCSLEILVVIIIIVKCSSLDCNLLYTQVIGRSFEVFFVARAWLLNI